MGRFLDEPHMWALFLTLIAGLAFLFSFCGGPLFVADLLKPRFGEAGFWVATAPLMMALLGAFSFMELPRIGPGPELRSRLGSHAVVAGLAGVMIIGLMNAFTVWQLTLDQDRADRSLIITGIIVGTVSSVGYAYLAWQYLRVPCAPKQRHNKKCGTLPFLATRPTGERATFTFTGPDSLSQFMVWIVPILGGGCFLPPPFVVWQAAGVTAAAIYTLAALAIVIGLRNSIVVTPSLVVITRSWFFIPYWRYTGRAIQDVWYGGDWGDPEGACGIVVKLDGQEVHIGSAKTMHHLYASL